MHWTEAIQFSSQVGLRSGWAFLLAIILALVSFFIFGFLWGLLWNRKWGVFSHPFAAALNLFFAVVIGALVLAWAGADRSLGWLDTERENASRTFAESGALNREALRDAWEKLSPLGKQTDLASPSEGGNEIRLTSAEDARTLAASAAMLVKRHLVKVNPYDFGVNCFVRDPAAVADDVVAGIDTPTYPIVVRPDNAWTKAAIVSQVGSAFDATQRSVRTATTGLKLGLWLAVGTLLVLQITLTAMLALNDIKEDPYVERNTVRA